MSINAVAFPGSADPPADDETTLVRAAQIDPAAFGELHRRYETRVARYVRSRVDSNEDADDLTQQVFMRALDALPRYRDRKLPFAAWLFAIARNLVSDFHRGRRSSVPFDLLPEALHPDSSQDPEALSLQREAVDRLRVLLLALPKDRRELLALYFGGGLSLRESAAVLGKSYSTVQRQLSDTLATLKEEYGD